MRPISFFRRFPLADGTAQLRNGADRLGTGLADTRSDTDTLVNGMAQLQSGTGELGADATHVSRGVEQIAMMAEELVGQPQLRLMSIR